MAGVELLQLPHPDVEHLHLLVGGADADAVPAGMEVEVERPSLLIGEHVQALARGGPAERCLIKSTTYQQSLICSHYWSPIPKEKNYHENCPEMF